MAKKKKLKFSKKQITKIKVIALPIFTGLFGLMIGIFASNVLRDRHTPANLIWPTDNTVKVPKDLRAFLEELDDCNSYKDTDGPKGIGLWGVYQVSQGKFAKIAYGCSWSLTTYIMAIKQNDKWQLIQPTEYFAPFKEAVDPALGALPNCPVVDQYKIPKEIESFCVTNEGTAQPNIN